MAEVVNIYSDEGILRRLQRQLARIKAEPDCSPGVNKLATALQREIAARLLLDALDKRSNKA